MHLKIKKPPQTELSNQRSWRREGCCYSHSPPLLPPRCYHHSCPWSLQRWGSCQISQPQGWCKSGAGERVSGFEYHQQVQQHSRWYCWAPTSDIGQLDDQLGSSVWALQWTGLIFDTGPRTAQSLQFGGRACCKTHRHLHKNQKQKKRKKKLEMRSLLI